MKFILPNDTERNQRWAFNNGINFYSPEILEMIYYNDCETTDEKFPPEIELEVSFYYDEVDDVTYKGKAVDVPKWLEDEILTEAVK